MWRQVQAGERIRVVDIFDEVEEDLRAERAEKLLKKYAWLLIAVVVIYLVLGMLYESFIHPITILSGLPSAAIGALLILLATCNYYNSNILVK